MIGLLAAAIRDDDPVLVFEHKALYGTRGLCPDGEHHVPLGTAAVRREGSDVTFVALAATVATCLQAADHLAGEGISAEVIDLRSLVPLDARAVLGSVARTGRLVVVEENPGQLGWGAAIAALVAEEAFGDLRGPVMRVSGGNVPLPVAKDMEAEVSVSAARAAGAARAALGFTGQPVARSSS